MRWISKGKKKKYSLKRLIKSFGYAGRGMFEAFQTEQNLLIEFVVALVAIGLGIYFKLSSIEFCIVMLSIGLVIGLEFVNTSIEYTIDMAMPEIHPLAKIAKDVASSAVLFASICSVIVGLIIYLPKVIALF